MATSTFQTINNFLYLLRNFSRVNPQGLTTCRLVDHHQETGLTYLASPTKRKINASRLGRVCLLLTGTLRNVCSWWVSVRLTIIDRICRSPNDWILVLNELQRNIVCVSTGKNTPPTTFEFCSGGLRFWTMPFWGDSETSKLFWLLSTFDLVIANFCCRPLF